MAHTLPRKVHPSSCAPDDTSGRAFLIRIEAMLKNAAHNTILVPILVQPTPNAQVVNTKCVVRHRQIADANYQEATVLICSIEANGCLFRQKFRCPDKKRSRMQHCNP